MPARQTELDPRCSLAGQAEQISELQVQRDHAVFVSLSVPGSFHTTHTSRDAVSELKTSSFFLEAVLWPFVYGRRLC